LEKNKPAHMPVASSADSLYHEAMDITLTSEIKALIRQHLAHGCSDSPEAVVLKALRVLQELELRDPSPDDSATGETDAPSAETERRALQELADQGVVRLGNGGKPRGTRGVSVRGEPMSQTVLDARR
jgi:hypothetical protein